MHDARYGAIEAGGTKFVCEVTDADGTPLAAARIVTTTPEDTFANVLQFFSAQQEVHGSISAFGIAAFGPLDLRRDAPTFGRLLNTPKPFWSQADFVAPLRAAFNCPAAIDTDVNAAALAEAQCGAGRGCSSVVYVTVGTGIGGGACIDGHTLKGALHPEMGHIRVLRHADDPTFNGCCPFHGDCLEGLASGTAIAARYGVPLDRMPGEHAAIEIVGGYLGQLATTCILLLSPQRLVFGGGVMQQQALYPVIRTTAARLLNGYAGIGADDGALEELIVPPGLGERAGITGAFLLARTEYQTLNPTTTPTELSP